MTMKRSIKIMIIVAMVLNLLSLVFEVLNYAFAVVDSGTMITIYRGTAMINFVLLAGILGEAIRNKGRKKE